MGVGDRRFGFPCVSDFVENRLLWRLDDGGASVFLDSFETVRYRVPFLLMSGIGAEHGGHPDTHLLRPSNFIPTIPTQCDPFSPLPLDPSADPSVFPSTGKECSQRRIYTPYSTATPA